MITTAHVLAARRELAKRGLLDFTRYTMPSYEAAAHHRRIADALEAVERGDLKRLMLFLPPRSGKSELASKRFPAWCLGRNPRRQIIAASYNSDLATHFGRQVRNIVAGAEFGEVFPGVGLAPDSKAANRMNTSAGGAYLAAGVGTAMTGFGADIAIIDDPVKDRAEADSETMREAAWDWYRSTLYTRLMPGAAVVVCQTRWHEDDLSGRLLEQNAAEWHVIEMPAIDAAGQALWPEWYPLDAIESIRATIGPREFSALYMQRPQPDDGTFFRREWLSHWQDRPTSLNIYASSDYAVTDEGGDWTVFCIWGVDPAGKLFRLATWKAQATADVWIEQQCKMIREWKPLAWFGESGVIQKAIEPMLRRRMWETKASCRLEWVPSISDKPTRARSFQARAAMGMVAFEPGADLSEFLAFPAGKHDDEVDCASLIGRVIDETHPAIVRTSPVVSGPSDRWHRPKRSELSSSVWG
jgi:predicted phage terminase large subunit-like protein